MTSNLNQASSSLSRRHPNNDFNSEQSSSTSSGLLPFKGSFANLAKLIGLRKVSQEEEEEDEEDGEGTDNDHELGIEEDDGENDEESLMWDAQTALIAHHPDLAIKLYTQAALPPICSSSACLALGNLLLRGSTLTEHEHHQDSSDSHHDHSSSVSSESIGHPTNGDTLPSKILNKLFSLGGYGSTSTSISNSSSSAYRPSLDRKPTTDLVASGWQIPKEGKRAIRDVKSMGVAGAWFVLGLSWLVQDQLEREKQLSQRRSGSNQLGSVRILLPSASSSSNGDKHNELREHEEVEDELLSFDPKGKNKRINSNQQSHSRPQITIDTETQDIQSNLSDSVDTICPPKSNPSSSSGRTFESPMVRTPGDGLMDDPFNQNLESEAKDLQVLQTMYDLLQPLLKLYRHGHIQSQDPVALPPISLSTLPAILRPRNEAEKGRNVWRLGNVVASKIVSMNLVKQSLHTEETELKELEKLRDSVNILVNYILAMTSPEPEAEVYFRNVVSNSPTGYEMADDLIRQAAKRLDIITSSPRDENTMNGFPFPATTSTTTSPTKHLSPPKIPSPITGRSQRKSSLSHHSKKPSTSSITSLSASRIFSTPIKSSASMASLCSVSDGSFEPVTIQLNESDCAVSSLKKVHARSMADLREAFNSEEIEVEDIEEELGEPTYPSLEGWKLSPPLAEESNPPTFGVSQQSQRTIVPTNINSIKDNSYNSRGRSGLGTSPANTLRPVASSPQFGTLKSSSLSQSQYKSVNTASSTPRRKLPFEPCDSQMINPIDPELAKAELSSALTKHVTCGVCEMQGVNFPECRKCGLTFCSRDCRVGVDKAGNGKKHICGLWESKKLLSTKLSDSSSVNSSLSDKSNLNVGRAVSPVRATRVF